MVYFMENHMFPWEDLGGIFPRLHLPWPLGGKKLSPRTPPAVPRSERSWEIPQNFTGKPWDSYRKTRGNPQLGGLML